MWDFPYDSPSAISELLERNGFAMSKKFGQNFLLSSSAGDRIASSLGSIDGQQVWEIGPGLGALTARLLGKGALVTVFEIDHGFCRILREQAFADESRFSLVEGDALKTWMGVWESAGTPRAICGNLPYNVGSICIARLLEHQCLPPVMVYTLQREVAERLASEPGSKSWSTLSILAQTDYVVEQLFMIKGGSFYPPPKVDSAVVRLVKRDAPLVDGRIRELFLSVCSDLFSQRRKTVRNNLLQGESGARFGKERCLQALSDAHIVENQRAELLGFDELVRLANAFGSLA